MKTSIWFHTRNKNPNKSGFYLAFRGWGFGGPRDGESDINYFYYDKEKNKWREYEAFNRDLNIIVYYWTDADPFEWVENNDDTENNSTNPALEIAWKKLIEAYEQYKIIKSLTK